jgi:voltage-gated potassium channel
VKVTLDMRQSWLIGTLRKRFPGISQTGQNTAIDTTRRTMASASDRLLGSPLRHFAMAIMYMLVVIAVASTAYVRAGWTPGDAFYMVVVTVFTVGYAEVLPIDTTLLRTITISTIVFGCSGVFFLSGALVQFITLNQLNQFFGVKRMTTQIDHLKDHIIVCGFGRIGVMLARELHAGGAAFVVLEQSEAAVTLARNSGYLCLQADATDEAALRAAGVERARALATVLSNEAANVFITLSARSLNSEMEIIARGEQPSTESKLHYAGANKVVLPTHIGAERIAEMLLYQETARFIRGSERMKDFEKVLRSLGLDMDVVIAAPGSPVVGRTLEAVEQQASGAFFIVQINRRGGEPVTQPEPATLIEEGDGLVVVGRGAQARALSGLFEARGRAAFRTSAR